jgi:hypothetical protein
MDDKKNGNIEYALADIITGKPHEFKVGRKLFRLYPITLAKQFIQKRIIGRLGLNTSFIQNPYLEALRVAETNKKACCEIIALHATPNTYKDLHNSKAMTERRNVFEKMRTEDVATMLVNVLTTDYTKDIIEYFGIDKEQKRLAVIMEIKRKNSKNNLSFGGLTIFGTFIGQLKEMGYTDDEILYEKGYAYLRLMLADKITSVYLTDEELQDVPADSGGTMIDGNSPEAFEKLKTALAGRGLKFND